MAEKEFSCCLAYVPFGTYSLALRSLFTRTFYLTFILLYRSCGAVKGLYEMYGHVHMIHIPQNFHFGVNLYGTMY